MGILDGLFGKSKNIITENNNLEELTNTISMKEVFSSSELFSSWIIENIVQALTLEEDKMVAPDAEQCKILNITYEQVERLAMEQSLLRAVGACIFVKKFYDDKFYLEFFSYMYKGVAINMYNEPTRQEVTTTKNALEVYVNSIINAGDEELKAFQKQYMVRIYDDSDNYYNIMLAGVPTIGLTTTFDMFDVIQNEYHKIMN